MIKKVKDRGYEIGEDKRELAEYVTSNFTVNFSSIKLYMNNIAKALRVNGYEVKVCEIKVSKRAVIGASEPFGFIPFEIGLSFDYILNIPYIPGSSLKGAFRHAFEELLIQDLVVSKSKPTEVYAKSEGINEVARELADKIFGSESCVGLLGVTDAYPIAPNEDGRIIIPDTITPHYPGSATELDVKPNPILFLAIAQGVTFRFYVFYKKTRDKNKLTIISSDDIKVLKSKVKYASIFKGDLNKILKEIGASTSLVPWIDRAILYALAKGIGAKTAIGYSRFLVTKYCHVGDEIED